MRVNMSHYDGYKRSNEEWRPRSQQDAPWVNNRQPKRSEASIFCLVRHRLAQGKRKTFSFVSFRFGCVCVFVFRFREPWLQLQVAG